MNKQVFTVIEVALIAGLIVVVLYWGGVFEPKPNPLPATATSSPQFTATPRPSNTPEPTLQPTATVTSPALVQPSGLIAFESTRDGNTDIFIMNADGSNQTNLTNNPADDFNFVWSPDGTRIAFFSTRTGWLEIFAMDVDGSNVAQVTNTFGSNTAYNPPIAWSPDGEYILAIRSVVWRSGYELSAQSLDRIQTSDPYETLTVYADSNKNMQWPTWSPDGRYITVSMNDRLSCSNYRIDVADLERQIFEPLAFTPMCGPFAWSPDGSRVAYPLNSIVIGGLNAVPQFTIQVSASQYNVFSWSPQGKYFLYTAASGYVDAVSSDGARVVRLSLPSGNSPTWAPDDQWLAYIVRGQLDISILNIYDPYNKTQLTNTNNSYAPQWQPYPANDVNE